jgi:hypothetical protein
MRLRAPAAGTELTTSGSCLLFSARSMAPNQAERDERTNLGADICRRASPPHCGHCPREDAAPMGSINSNVPCCGQQNSYITMLRLLRWHAGRIRKAHREPASPRLKRALR